MRIAFVTHNVGLYGAARSLHASIMSLIRAGFLGRDELVLIYNQSLTKKTPSLRESFLFRKFQEGIPWVLPTSGVYKGGRVDPLSTFKRVVRLATFAVLWRSRYRGHLANSSVDRVHLNSLTLWPMLLVLPRHLKVIIHIREILDERRNRRLASMAKHVILSRCHRIIAIDKMTAAPFLGSSAQVHVLKNPFDMRRARTLRNARRESICTKYGLQAGKQHIALIGRIQELKGPKLFLDLARRCTDADGLEFLLVGLPVDEVGQAVVAEAAHVPNLHHLGEIQDIQEVLALTEIVVRCEAFLPLGRTVWEGYYSGADVVLPARRDDDLSEVRQFLGNGIYSYEAGNLDDLGRRIMSLTTQRADGHERRPSGNTAAFAERFWRLLERG